MPPNPQRQRRQLRLEALKSLLEDSGLEFRDGKKSFVLTCPQCGHEDKLYIRQTDGRFVCWYCRDRTPGGFEGYAEVVLARLLDKPIQVIRDLLYGAEFKPHAILDIRFKENYSFAAAAANVVGNDADEDFGEDFVPLEDVAPKDKGATPGKPLIRMLWPPDYYPIGSRQAQKGLDYLRSRGIDLELAQEYDLRYHPGSQRVVFPVVTNGTLVGWQARTIGKSEWLDAQTEEHRRMPKILTTMLPQTRDHVLMFESRVRPGGHAVLVEGPVDAIKCHLCGGNVASMGKGVSDGQIQRLLALGVKRLYLGLDPDAAAETSVLVKRYGQSFEAIHYMTPVGTGYEDFGAMTPEMALECFRRAPVVHPPYIFLPY